MTPAPPSTRALILAPRGRDAAVAIGILAEAGIAAEPVETVTALAEAFANGVGLAVCTEEALSGSDLKPLDAWLSDQPEWSDLPFILLTNGGGGLERNPTASRFLAVLGNVTFLERPFHPTTLVSLARSALRGRSRQYAAQVSLRQLQEGAERYRSLFESIDAGFCIIEMIFEHKRPVDYRFLETNPAFVGQTGLTAVEGRRVSELAPGHEQYWNEVYGEVALTGKSVRYENESVPLGRWFDVHAFRVGPPEARRVAVLFNDITQRRRMEQELRELTTSLEQRVEAATEEREAALAQLHEVQKLETLGQLTGGVAHDFNNLLTPITTVLDLLNRRYGRDDPRAARLIGGALESAERAKTLVQRLLGFARRQTLETRPIDLAALMQGMRDLLASSVGAAIEVQLRFPPDLPAAMADPNQLELAVLNLCVNARDAMPNGGRLTIAAEAATVGAGELPGVAPGSYVRLSVSDTGTGMDEATLARAIEPFFTTKDVGKGTGLGLSMVHGLASQLGGGFRLTSAVGRGTRIDLWLPTAAEAEMGLRTALADVELPPMPPLNVLLVDDEPLVRAATAAMLRDLGHTVSEAAGASDALARLADIAPDVVVTDYKMPKMNGAKLIRRIAAEQPGLPALLITGYSGPAEGALDLPRLDKPFRRAELAAALARVMSSTGAAAPHRPGSR